MAMSERSDEMRWEPPLGLAQEERGKGLPERQHDALRAALWLSAFESRSVLCLLTAEPSLTIPLGVVFAPPSRALHLTPHYRRPHEHLPDMSIDSIMCVGGCFFSRVACPAKGPFGWFRNSGGAASSPNPRSHRASRVPPAPVFAL